MTNSQIFFYFCLSFILGIAIDSYFSISWSILFTFLILGLFFFSFFLIQKKVAVFGLCFILFTIGIWHHQTFEWKIRNSPLKKIAEREETIILTGRIVKEPEIKERSLKLTLRTESIKLTGNSSLSIEGKILITTNRFPEYEYGDKIKVKGRLQNPPVFEDFNYRDYLANQGIVAVMYWPEIELVGKRERRSLVSEIYAQILFFKNKLRKVIDQNLSPPQSLILAAILLGDKRKMPQELKEKLNFAGVRHITAISGMHITILGLLILEIFLGLKLWRNQALYLSLIFLFLFIVMIGAPSSAVRAGIMGGFLLIAQSLGRVSSSIRGIVLAGTLILALNPLLLKSDIGFQLSFLATLGVIYLTPIFQAWFKKIPDNLFGFIKLKNIIAMTLSAQTFTFPLLIYNFGRFSLVAPLTNLFIVPFLPLLIITGFLFILLSFLWQPLTLIFLSPCWLILTYIIKIINFFWQNPWSVVWVEISWFWLLIFYFILGAIIYYLKQKERFKFLG